MTRIQHIIHDSKFDEKKLPSFLAIILTMVSCVTPINKSYSQSVRIFEDPAISRLMDAYVAQAQATETFKGWRIQIVTTDDRRKMESAKREFESNYRDKVLTWEHVVPYYRIRVGAYKDKLELQPFLMEVRTRFPAAIPVMDDIPKAELVQLN